MDFFTIASGSSGNSIFASTESTSILIDAGISMKKIEEGLNTHDRTLRDIDAILITHEHIDHIKGIGAISRKYNIPIYSTKGTMVGINNTKSVGDIDNSLFNTFEVGDSFNIADIKIKGTKVFHDAYEPCCYSIESYNNKISIVTDLGEYDDAILSAVEDSDILMIEANHDIRMVECGPYPYILKQRILGKYGHLSNEACGKLLFDSLNSHVKLIMLGHLSKENNFPELALETVKGELINNPFTNDVRDFNLMVAGRDNPSKLFQI